MNYDNLTGPHPKWWFMWGDAPQPPYFRLVKYYDSPRSYGFGSVQVGITVERKIAEGTPEARLSLESEPA